MTTNEEFIDDLPKLIKCTHCNGKGYITMVNEFNLKCDFCYGYGKRFDFEHDHQVVDFT